ncbi:MAG: hypothetical protein EP334_10420 [Gammaproteobacteria bacterium]|nr:MAG: hypothetical protein EP334_10420 [Gammaproteobacteria bacterium]
MKKHDRILIAASVGALLLLAPTIGLQAADVEKKQDLPAVMVGAGSIATATVEAIDHASRTVTLRKKGGESVSFVVSEEVRNLPQVEIGDVVVATYEVGMVMALAPASSGIPARRDTVETARAEPGQKPAGIVRKTVQVSATVRAVDSENRTVTLQGPKQIVTLPVAKDIDLDSFNVGDQVHAMYRESMAIKVEPAPVAVK